VVLEGRFVNKDPIAGRCPLILHVIVKSRFKQAGFGETGLLTASRSGPISARFYVPTDKGLAFLQLVRSVDDAPGAVVISYVRR
jgi:hypothetical protein